MLNMKVNMVFTLKYSTVCDNILEKCLQKFKFHILISHESFCGQYEVWRGGEVESVEKERV